MPQVLLKAAESGVRSKMLATSCLLKARSVRCLTLNTAGHPHALMTTQRLERSLHFSGLHYAVALDVLRTALRCTLCININGK